MAFGMRRGGSRSRAAPSQSAYRLRATVEAMAEENEDDWAFFLDIANDLEAVDAGPDPKGFARISNVLDRLTARFD